MSIFKSNAVAHSEGRLAVLEMVVGTLEKVTGLFKNYPPLDKNSEWYETQLRHQLGDYVWRLRQLEKYAKDVTWKSVSVDLDGTPTRSYEENGDPILHPYFRDMIVTPELEAGIAKANAADKEMFAAMARRSFEIAQQKVDKAAALVSHYEHSNAQPAVGAQP